MDRQVWEPWIPCPFHNRPPPLLDNTPGDAMAPFDPTLPSTRLVQQWIRRQRPLVVMLHQGRCLEGRLLWQDPVALALQLHDGLEPVLVQRRSVALIHPAAVSLETATRRKPTTGGAMPSVEAASRQRRGPDDHGGVSVGASSGQS